MRELRKIEKNGDIVKQMLLDASERTAFERANNIDAEQYLVYLGPEISEHEALDKIVKCLDAAFQPKMITSAKKPLS